MRKIILFTLSLLLAIPMTAQVKVPFKKRSSAFLQSINSSDSIYHIQGDFQMIGNTNLTLQPYSDNGNNAGNMVYVDIDDDPQTLNSSSATLEFSTENGAIPGCSEILYAGLYWTGRAHDGTSNHTFSVTKNNIPGAVTTQTVNNDQTVATGNSVTYTDYSLTITRSGNNNNRTLTYTFTSSGSGDKVAFIYAHNGGNQTLQVRVNDGTATTVPTSSINADNAYLQTPYVIYNETGGIVLTVSRLERNGRNSDVSVGWPLTNVVRAYTNVSGTYHAYGTVTKTFDKSKVLLKHASKNSYEPIEATVIKNSSTDWSGNIYFPRSGDEYMYSAYADVTDYVKANGLGEYFVADIALRELNSGGNGAGVFGGWGMIVVYENSKMKWRDIAIFDGHAYVAGSTTVSHILEIEGFNTAQSGDIDMKLGLIAGEGDVDITGDYFQILPHEHVDKTTINNNWWVNLSHSGNATNNFFNASIPSAAPRNPELKNNTGLDIAMFNINNANNSIIKNEQTKTKFRYGSTQDTYIINTIAMAVDAYVPEIVPYIYISGVNGPSLCDENCQVLPGEDVEYVLEIRNPGNEDVLDAKIVIPLPYNATCQGVGTATYAPGVGAGATLGLQDGTPDYIEWYIGTLPEGSNDVLATLTFTLTATDDCYMLVNEHCQPIISVVGTATGVGATSNASTGELRFIYGYRDDDGCEDEPLKGPLILNIDAADFVNEHCGGADNPEYKTRTIKMCKPVGNNKLPFRDITQHFPPGSKFYDKIDIFSFDDEGNKFYEGQPGYDEENKFVEPAGDAIEFTTTNSFPPTIGTTTYYAVPPGLTNCWWEFTIEVEVCNLWYGGIDTDWGKAGNWTNNIIPTDGEDVIFATEENYQADAMSDLHLDQYRRIGNLVNKSPKALVITAVDDSFEAQQGKKLVITEKADVTNDGSHIVIQSRLGLGNGSLIFEKPNLNGGIRATIEFDSRSEKITEGVYPRRWQYIGTPVIGARPIDVFGSDVSGGKYGNNVSIRKHDESKNDPSDIGDKWSNVIVTDPMVPFHGYEVVQNAQNQTVYRYVGTLNLTDHEVLLDFTPGVDYRGQYILANSFVAPIALTELLASDFSNLEQAIYLYNTGSRDEWQRMVIDGTVMVDIDLESEVTPGTYSGIAHGLINTVAGSSLFKQIPSMNGFLVRRLPNKSEDNPNGYEGGQISFKFRYDALDKADNSLTAPMRVKREVNKDAYPLIRVSLRGSTWVDRAYLATVPGTSKYFDNGWDARKIISSIDDQIYVLTNKNERFQMSSDKDLNGTTLGFYRATADQQYTLTFNFTNMEGVYHDIYVEDLLTGTHTQLQDGSTIHFTAKAGDPEARFRLHAQKNNDPTTDGESLLGINYFNGNTFTIINSSNEKGTVTVYDVTGKPLLSERLNQGVSQHRVELPKGIYIIEAKTKNYFNKQKVAIH